MIKEGELMNIAVVGSGRWASFIAYYVQSINHNIMIYGRKDSENFAKFTRNNGNDLVQYKDGVKFTTDIYEALDFAKIIIISISSQQLRSFLQSFDSTKLFDKTVVLCMKGIETSTKKRLSEVVKEFSDAKTAIWVGPGHVSEFMANKPNCMVIDSNDESTKNMLIDSFTSNLIRFYYGDDLIGNEIGAALKNVIGIAGGMLDALDLTSLKGALMSRATHEVGSLIKALGGKASSAYGLAHLGDYEATVFSLHSHNRKYGETLVKGQKFDKLAEGVYTCKAAYDLANELNIAMPITRAVYDVLYNNVSASEALKNLFLREQKSEGLH